MTRRRIALIAETLSAYEARDRFMLALAGTFANRGDQVHIIVGAMDPQAIDERLVLHANEVTRRSLLPWLPRFVRWQRGVVESIGPDAVVSLTPIVSGDALVPLDGVGIKRGRSARSRIEWRVLKRQRPGSVLAVTAPIARQIDSLVTDRRLSRRVELPIARQTVDLSANETLRKKLARAFGMDWEAAWFIFPFLDRAGSGFDVALEALERYLATGERGLLLLTGRASYGQLDRVAEVGLGDSVRWLGPIEQYERLFALADGVVVPGGVDAGGWDARLAVSLGRPVVVGASSGAADGMDGRVHVLASPATGQALADMLSKLKSQPAEQGVKDAFSDPAECLAVAIDDAIAAR